MSSSSKPASLARRVWPAVALAGASAAFLSSLDKPATLSFDEVALTGSQDAVGVTIVNPTTTLAPTTTVPPVPTATAEVVAVPITTVPPAPTTVATTLPPDTGLCNAQPIAGPVVNTRWGPVQVQATLRLDGTVCEVSTLVTPNSHRRSVQINNRATPILHDRVVTAGGTSFQSVSGATVTSNGYRSSLQAILDNA